MPDTVLLNLGEPGALDIDPWADRGQRIDARYAGVWELPVLGAGSRYLGRSRRSRCADLGVHDGPIRAFTIDRNPHFAQKAGNFRRATEDSNL